MAKPPEFESDAERALRKIEEATNPAAAALKKMEEASPAATLRRIEEAMNPAAATLKKMEEASPAALLRRIEEATNPAAAALKKIEGGAPKAQLDNIDPVLGDVSKLKIHISVPKESDDLIPLFPRKDWRTTHIPPGSDLPIEQQISDSRDATRDDGAFEAGGFGAGGFGAGPFGGGLNTGPLNSQALNEPGPMTRIIAGLDEPPASQPVPPPPPSAGTSPIFVGGEPPAPDPSLVGGPRVVTSPLVIREGESLTVTEANPSRLRANAYERVGSPPHKEIALIQLRGLIEACDEAVNFDRARNVRPPYLWLDDKQYLAELRDILLELRRLNDFLEASNSAESTVLKSANKTASRFGQFLDAYASEMGKGAAQLTKGAILLALIYAGVSEATLAKLLGK